jgi:hypothetical protein
MPYTYTLTGYDSAGAQHVYQLDASGAVTSAGDDTLLTDWLGEHPMPDPPDDAPEPDPDAPLTPERLDQIRQHASLVLTYVVVAPVPEPEEGGDLTTPPPVVEPQAGPEPTPTVSDPPTTPYVPPGA